MRPLKRPMFKYGGDVKKQGIMHGMNGLRDGGVATTMADATGLANGGMPNMRGRVTGPGGYAGLPFGGALQQPPANPNFNQQTTPNKITKTAGKIGNFYDKGKNFVKSPAFSEKGIFDAVKKYGPKAINVGKGIVGGGITRFPAVAAALGMEYVTRPSEFDKVLAEQEGYGPYESRFRKTLDLTYTKKMLDLIKKQPELFDTARGITPKKKTDKDGLGLNVPDAVSGTRKLTQAEIEAAKKANEDKKLKRIYSLLGVDRAKRGAASKALADMSRYIDEGGKDTISRKNLGSTLTKGILAFDKRLDKVDQLKEAAGLMMAKAEIDAMSDPYGKEFKKLSVEEKRKAAKDAKDPRALALTLPNFKGRTLSHADTISLAKIKNADAVVLADSKKAKDEGIGKTITADDYVKKQIELDTSGDVAGVYVVDKVIIQVDEQGNRTQLLP